MRQRAFYYSRLYADPKARDTVYPLFFSGMPVRALKERWQWTFPIVFSPHDANVLYTSSQHLWKTTNDGLSWERISPDLTRADPKTLGDSGGPITKDQNGPEIYGTIFTIAPSRVEANTIWTGSDDGLAHITRDGGKKWEKITPPGLPEFSRISLIEASPHKPGTAYLAAKRYQLDDRAPYIFKTDDYGKTWTKIVNGIRPDDYVHAVREDTKRPGLLYAGAEHCIYVSFDDGANWKSLSLNLPDTQVPDLVVEENDLVIATHGRSFYILDDIAVLRQITPEFATAGVHLFQPLTAIRSVNQSAIDYSLKQPARQSYYRDSRCERAGDSHLHRLGRRRQAKTGCGSRLRTRRILRPARASIAGSQSRNESLQLGLALSRRHCVRRNDTVERSR